VSELKKKVENKVIDKEVKIQKSITINKVGGRKEGGVAYNAEGRNCTVCASLTA